MSQSSNVKLCECGCGRPAPLAARTDTRKGWIKDHPIRFIGGHSTAHKEPRKKVRYTVEDRGYVTPCWIWQLTCGLNGYGHVKVNYRARFAHRHYYEQRFGQIPPGLQLDHLCGIRPCVNPDHLEVVTPKENTWRGRRSKLTKQQAREIRVAYEAGGITQRTLAQQYAVSRATISRVVLNKGWLLTE